MFNKSAKPQSGISPAPIAPQPAMEPPIVETTQPIATKQSSQKLLVIVSGVVLLFALAAGVFLMNQKPPTDNSTPQPSATATPQPTEEPTACTMDAKICPDGSSVGRVAPSCEFEACPGEANSTNTSTFSNQSFSFSHPKEWIVDEEEGFIKVYENQENASLGGVNYFMSISEVDLGTTKFQKYYDEPVGNKTEEDLGIYITKLKNLMVDGKPAVITMLELGKDSATDATPGWSIYIKNGNKVIIIGMSKHSTEGTEENLNTVINSFEFN